MRFFITILLAGFLTPLYALTNVSAPGTLSQDNETYVLTRNIIVDGTAFTVDGNNITFDLNNYVITYNKVNNGAGIIVRGSNNEITNGYIAQGEDRSGTSPAVLVTASGGGGHTISYLGINVNGIVAGQDNYAAGVEVYARETTVHHVFIENNGETSDTSYSPRGIHADNRTVAGFTFNNNIIVNSHLGISLAFVGLNTSNPTKTRIFNNYIQHIRRPGTKAPYGIQLAKTRNVDVYNNQIITDEGRGIMCDGFGQGVTRGTDYINVYNNRIDVEYRVTASNGAYVENNIYGIRDRYSSGNNKFYDNTIMVNNEAGGVTAGLFIGSDSFDSLMTGLEVTGNKIIARDDNNEGHAIRYAYTSEMTVLNNEYSGNSFSEQDFSYGSGSLTVANNNVFPLATYTPNKPSGLLLKKFFNAYVLTWSDNNESETFEYIVYRDGTPLDMSTRGGNFFVDTNVTGDHSYTVVAKSLRGNTSAQSDPVSTSSATTGWGSASLSSLRPLPPQEVTAN